MNDNRRQAYVEWVTGLDTEPPIEGAFNAGWHARDVEVERLRAALQGLLPLLTMIEDEPETDAEILRAIWDARLALGHYT